MFSINTDFFAVLYIYVIHKRSASNKWRMLKGKIIFDTTFNVPRATPVKTKNFILWVLIPNSFLNLFASENRKIDKIVDITGWIILNLVRSSLVESKSSASPSINDALGNNTSANAVIEPVAPVKKNRMNAIFNLWSKNNLATFDSFRRK